MTAAWPFMHILLSHEHFPLCSFPTTHISQTTRSISRLLVAAGFGHGAYQTNFIQMTSYNWTFTLFFRVYNSTEQSPSREANRSSASQKIPRILCNPKVHYRIHNSPPIIPRL
jgi:hypothetical protein